MKRPRKEREGSEAANAEGGGKGAINFNISPADRHLAQWNRQTAKEHRNRDKEKRQICYLLPL